LCWKKIFTYNVATHSDFTDEELLEKLKETDWGLCVFHANNDMPDHQLVNMEFEGGVHATLNLNAFNSGGRYTRIFGTKGELFAFMSDENIHVHTFSDKKDHVISVKKTEESIAGGHGGGDAGIVYDLYEYLCGIYQGVSVSDIGVSVSNHLIGFAAEEARHGDIVVSLEQFSEKVSCQNN
jgi:predicted dehydrogenase